MVVVEVKVRVEWSPCGFSSNVAHFLHRDCDTVRVTPHGHVLGQYLAIWHACDVGKRSVTIELLRSLYHFTLQGALAELAYAGV